MPEARAFPYPQFNFRVKIGTQDENDPILAGFQEVSGLGLEVNIAEYRSGNSQSNMPIKVPGLGKCPDVTLKRGVIGAADLFEWTQDIRDGVRDDDTFRRNVVIKLMAEDRQTTAMEWTLLNARPMKYTAPSLNGKGTDLAIEELVLSAEDISVEVP